MTALPAFYRELYEAMESIAQSLEYDIPTTLEWMHGHPRSSTEEVYMSRHSDDHSPLPTVDDVRTFVAFMRDGIRTRGGQP